MAQGQRDGSRGLERTGGIKGVALRLMKGFHAERATPEQIRWLKTERLAKRYGWTLDYTASLSVLDTERLFGLIEAEKELEKLEAEKRKQLGSQRRGRRGRR